MKVGIIGAGRAGCAFAFALADRGVELTGAYSRNPESAAFICNKLGLAADNNLESLIEKSSVLIIAVPDAEIVSSALQISAHECVKGKTFLHCSGASSSELLKPIKEAGGYTGSLHPAQSFPDKESSWERMFNIFFGYEGSEEAKTDAARIVDKLGGRMLVLDSRAKPLYHAAACVISNYAVTLSYTAGNLLEAAGIDRDAGLKAFIPLMTGTVSNIVEKGSENALTGPVSRGDTITVAGHLAAMEGRTDIETIELYKAAGRATAKMAFDIGAITAEKYEEIIRLLK